MRLFEWFVALVVVAIVWHWVGGRRAPVGLALLGLALTAVSVLAEGQRAAMWPAYLVIVGAVVASFRGAAVPPASAGIIRWTVRGVGAVVTLVLGVGLPWIWPVMKLPTPTGPHRVGTAWLVVRDSTRRERFTTTPGAAREFPVKIWYPAPVTSTGRLAPYAEPEEMSVMGLIPPILARQIRLTRTHAIVGAPMLEGRAPVLIFSHGYTGYAAQNTPQMEELASRGYVVASIAHTGEASWTPFPDGRGVPIDSSVVNTMGRLAARAKSEGGDPKRMADSLSRLLSVPDRVERQANFRKYLDGTSEPLRSQSVREWALDTKALVDLLGELYTGHAKSPFMGKLDLGHIGIFGMSYGGATAGEFCRQDRRCGAAINIDGGQFGGLVDDSLTIPLLIVGSEQAGGFHLPVLDLARGPAYLAVVPATNHVGLTDLTLQGPAFRWLGITGKLDPDRREAIMTDFVVGFFEKYLMNRNPGLFDGLASRYPEVQITKRNAP